HPCSDNQWGMTFTLLDDWVVSRADDIVRMHLWRRPFRPLPSGSLRDAVAQTACFRNLRFGDELSAPQRLVQRVHQTIAIRVMCIEAFRRCSPGVQQGENATAVSVVVHQLVVIPRAVPAAGSIEMFAIRQLGVIQMTRLVPARHLEATALNE